MLDIKLVRTNPDLVRENIKKKFQDHKLPLVDEVLALDKEFREAHTRADYLRSQRNSISKSIGALMGQGKKDEAEAAKQQVNDMADEMARLAVREEELSAEIKKRMLVIPNIIDDSVPIGKDDSENVEVERFGEPFVPEFEIPYHVEIMENLRGIDLDSARKTSGNGFYYLCGDIALLQSAILAYARDFMVDRGFTYYIPPFMIRSGVVDGVMSFTEMEGMMYKIEGEDLYLIGTSEHSMIGKFIDTFLEESELPQTLTSYSPCFRKEVGAHGIEERGVYRIHQFEKQEMIVVCKPEESMDWFYKQEHDRLLPYAGYSRAFAGVLLGRSGRPQGQEHGRGSLVSAPEEVFRGRQLLELGRRAGAAARHPRKEQGDGQLLPAYAQQHGCSSPTHADCVSREQPPRGRQRGNPRGAQAVLQK